MKLTAIDLGRIKPADYFAEQEPELTPIQQIAADVIDRMGTNAGARALGASPASLRGWKRGEYMPTQDFLDKMTDLLGRERMDGGSRRRGPWNPVTEAEKSERRAVILALLEGMERTELAERLGVTLKHVGRWARGEMPIPDAHADAMREMEVAA